MQPTIVPLCDHPELIPTLAGWFLAEWAPFYGPDGPGDATSDLSEHPGPDGLPMILVALDEQGTALGTAALKRNSVGDAPGPWLAAVFVAPQRRRRGIGTALTAAIEIKAQELGFDADYCSTDATDGIMRHRGWQNIGKTGTLRGTIALFRKKLNMAES